MDRSDMIREIVIGVVGLLVLIGSALWPQFATQLKELGPLVIALVLAFLGIPATAKVLNAYFAMRVQAIQSASRAPEKHPVQAGRE